MQTMKRKHKETDMHPKPLAEAAAAFLSLKSDLPADAPERQTAWRDFDNAIAPPPVLSSSDPTIADIEFRTSRR